MAVLSAAMLWHLARTSRRWCSVFLSVFKDCRRNYYSGGKCSVGALNTVVGFYACRYPLEISTAKHQSRLRAQCPSACIVPGIAVSERRCRQALVSGSIVAFLTVSLVSSPVLPVPVHPTAQVFWPADAPH